MRTINLAGALPNPKLFDEFDEPNCWYFVPLYLREYVDAIYGGKPKPHGFLFDSKPEDILLVSVETGKVVTTITGVAAPEVVAMAMKQFNMPEGDPCSSAAS